MTAMRYFDHHIVTPLLALTLLLASGCRSNVSTSEPATESTSSTMVTLRTSVIGSMGTRAVSENNADPLDGSGEGAVHMLNLWLAKEGWMQATPDTRNAPTYQATFKVNGVQKSEKRDYTILLNGHTLPLNTLSRSEQTTIGLDQISLLMDENGFTMTGAVNLSAVIMPDVETPARSGDNVFPKDEPLPVERVVSKAQLYKKSGFTPTGVPGTIANLHWAVAGSGKQVYLYRNNAGDRTMGADGLYDELTTASVKSELMKLSDVINEPTDEGNFAWKELSETPSEKKSVADGIYFYEHALEETEGQSKPYPRKIGYDKVTYAKVYGDLGKISKGKRGEFNENASALFSPMSRVVATEEEAQQLTTCEVPNLPYPLKRGHLETWEKMREYVKDASSEDFMEDRWYWVCVTEIPKWDMAKKKELFDSSRFSTPDLMDPHRGHTFFLMHDTPGTFYVGANGIIYDTLLAARADGNKSARKYAGGRMVYLTPLNAQGEPNKIYNCDTRRNNIYDLEIQGVNGLGYNYDPVDPKDPYIPKPDDNPLEPDPDPVIPPINNPEITIRVKATVLKWNYIHQSYDLLGKTK